MQSKKATGQRHYNKKSARAHETYVLRTPKALAWKDELRRVEFTLSGSTVIIVSVSRGNLLERKEGKLWQEITNPNIKDWEECIYRFVAGYKFTEDSWMYDLVWVGKKPKADEVLLMKKRLLAESL